MDTAPSKAAILPDPVIEAYKRDVDRTLLRENLRRSCEERCHALIAMARFVDELHAANKTARKRT